MDQGGDVERAAEWIFNHPEESTAMELDVGAGTQEASSAEASLPDGSGSKSLIFFNLVGYLAHNCLFLIHPCYG